jgi:hypothetical protein
MHRYESLVIFMDFHYDGTSHNRKWLASKIEIVPSTPIARTAKDGLKKTSGTYTEIQIHRQRRALHLKSICRVCPHVGQLLFVGREEDSGREQPLPTRNREPGQKRRCGNFSGHLDGKRASRHLTRSLGYDWPVKISNGDNQSAWILVNATR